MQNIIIASGPVIVENNKVLLVKHNDDFYKFCGGKTEKTENLLKAAKREAKEELGIKIEAVNNIPFIMYSKKEINKKEFDVILVHYLSKIIDNKEIKPGKDITEYIWLDLDRLENYNLAPNIIPALKHFNFIK